jgi:hypothetical protein
VVQFSKGAGYSPALYPAKVGHSIGYTQLAIDVAFEDLLLKNLIETRMAG